MGDQTAANNVKTKQNRKKQQQQQKKQKRHFSATFHVHPF